MVGRDAEVAAIEALVRSAHGGRSGVLLVTGDPGIGKTALLSHARSRTDGALVLETTGSEGESRLPFAGLADLLGPVLGHMAEIPEPQAQALRGALALGPPHPGDRFTAYAATLSLLAAAAEERRLMCLVDDAHWLDTESLEAIQFVARRLGAEGIAILVGGRSGASPLIDEAPLPHLRLVGLGAEDAGRLVARHAPFAPAADVRSALVSGAAGNPLALIELAGSLSRGQLSGVEPLPDPLPVGPYLQRALLRPLEGLSAATRRALLIASAGDGNAGLLVEALMCEDLALADLEPAERAGVIAVDPSRVRFSHPLVRSAVYQAAGPPDRRSAHGAHAAAARRLGGAGALDRRAWHLALASAGPDEEAAAELERAAGDARDRNAYAAAAEAMEAAARISPEHLGRGRRLLGAAGDAIASGALARAAALLDEVLAGPANPALALEARVIRGYVEMFGGSVRRAVDMLVAAAEAVREVAPWTAATLFAQATAPAQLRGDGAAMFVLAVRADALAADAPPPIRAITEAAVAGARTYRGEPAALSAEARDSLVRLAATGDPMAQFWAVAVVQFDVLDETYPSALDRLDGFVAGARSASRPSALPFPLCMRASVFQRLGRLQEARADAAEAAQVADETGQAMMVSFAYGTLAGIDAVLGRSSECRASARRAIADLEISEAEILVSYTDAALGLLALGEGRHGDGLGHLLAIERRLVHLGTPHPLIVPYAQDLIEARIRLGHHDEAARHLERFEAHADAVGAAWPRAAAARCRGLMAPDDAFEAHFCRALELHAGTPTPFERARTELCLGERRRRARRLREAREPLASALAAFDSLGAVPWADRARRELRAAGARPAEARRAAAGTLTPQELRIALAVAAGATDREAATALMISPKTVEYHLARIYTKLGLRSRTELAGRMAREQAVAPD